MFINFFITFVDYLARIPEIIDIILIPSKLPEINPGILLVKYLVNPQTLYVYKVLLKSMNSRNILNRITSCI